MCDNMMVFDVVNCLFGWLWGQGIDGKWQLQDVNFVLDVDLWIVYVLLEVVCLWQCLIYCSDVVCLFDVIEVCFVVDLLGLGKMVLLGLQGFSQGNQVWMFNLSYLLLLLLCCLYKECFKGLWQQIVINIVCMIQVIIFKGFVVDWVGYKMMVVQVGQFMVDLVKGELGSYDVICVYLWVGMILLCDLQVVLLLVVLDGMCQCIVVIGVVLEKVVVISGVIEGQGLFGFGVVLVLYLQVKGENILVV